MATRTQNSISDDSNANWVWIGLIIAFVLLLGYFAYASIYNEDMQDVSYGNTSLDNKTISTD